MLKYTSAGSITTIASSELNSQAIASTSVGAILSNTYIENNTSGLLLANFEVFINTQSARTGSPQVSLIIAPYVDAAYPDVGVLRLATPYIAKTISGVSATWLLDTAVTARTLTICGIVLPNCMFKVGLINESTQAFASSGNTIKMSDAYTYADS